MSVNVPRRLRVAVDVRCLASGELRGFARYTCELVNAMSTDPSLDVVAVSDVPMTMPDGVVDLAVHAPAHDREWRREQIGLPRLLGTLGIDVVLSPANRGLSLFGKPSVLTLHDAVEWDRAMVPRPHGRDLARFGYSNVASLLGATRIITVSHHAARELDQRLGIGADRVRIVPEAPGAAFLAEPDDTARRRLRAELGVAGPYVLYLGGFDPKKSVETLVAAWARLDPLTTPTLVLGGSIGEHENRLRRLVADLGGEPARLNCVGHVPDDLLPALYSAADVFVFPAVAEGFGLPPVEAMAVGTATVVADAGSLPEATNGGALRVPPRDVAALSRVLRRLVDDPEERAALGERGRRAVAARTWADVAQDTAGVLREAASLGIGSRVLSAIRSTPHAPRWVT